MHTVTLQLVVDIFKTQLKVIRSVFVISSVIRI